MVELKLELMPTGEASIVFSYGSVTWNIRVPLMYTIEEYISKFYTGTTKRHKAFKTYMDRYRKEIEDMEEIRVKIRKEKL